MQNYRVRRAADVTADLDLIEEHLVKSYQEFGEDLENAVERAAARIDDALAYMRTFVTHPHRGTEQAKIRPGIRTVTIKNFISISRSMICLPRSGYSPFSSAA